MIQIPYCISWSISQLMGTCVEQITNQTREFYEKDLCPKTIVLIYGNIKRKNEILGKISNIIPILNMYYDKNNYLWKENNEETIKKYKNDIDEFVKWLRGLTDYDEKILNIHDWNY